jgi:hypothetical protein
LVEKLSDKANENRKLQSQLDAQVAAITVERARSDELSSQLSNA